MSETIAPGALDDVAPVAPNGDGMHRTQRKPLPWMQIGLTALAVVVALYFGGRWAFYDRYRVSTDDAYIDTDQVMAMSRISEPVAAVYVDVNQRVRRGQLLVRLDDTIERAKLALARDNLRSLDASALAAHHSAELEHQLQSAEISSQDGAVRAAQRSAEAAQTRAGVSREAVAVAQADVGAARAAVGVAEAAVPGALDMLHQAERDRARSETLARQGYLAASAADSARTALSQARAAYNATIANVSTARANVRATEARLAQARANAAAADSGIAEAQAQIPVVRGKLQESQAPSRVSNKQALGSAAAATASASNAQLHLAELDLAATRIVSPVDGWVSARNVQIGQTVTPGQALIVIAPAKRIFVTANYKETQMGHIRIGAKVEISVDACSGQRFQGKVIGVNPVAQSALSTLPTLTAPSNFVKVPQRVPVRISLPADAGSCAFRPGLSVETAVLKQ